ncbi:hypothetical protein SAMN05421820_115133 [Pedobacter steynii]|uniref:Uncharacterized protein n=1 Tax=Pedobacter steynii TaxID=430522 RepID=A0A1H0K0I4_9SPHI|nr:hypothetical protein SAMN05421820_115133 [Pedobacter steynii]
MSSSALILVITAAILHAVWNLITKQVNGKLAFHPHRHINPGNGLNYLVKLSISFMDNIACSAEQGFSAWSRK